MIVRIIMTNVDILDYNHRINVTVALADQTAPACIDTRLLWVWILSLSCQIYIWIYSSFVYFVFVCVLHSFIIQHTVALLHQAQTTIKSFRHLRLTADRIIDWWIRHLVQKKCPFTHCMTVMRNDSWPVHLEACWGEMCHAPHVVCGM